jgi:hypothetical protein
MRQTKRRFDMRLGTGVAKTGRLWAAVAIFIFIPRGFAEPTVHDYCVELTASISENPAQITLQWLPNADANMYQISRKTLGEMAWTRLAEVDASQTSWTDTSAVTGVAYEYQVIKPTSAGYTGYGYICAAIRRNPVEDRGKMILLVEQDLGNAVAFELARLQQDLVGDGWTVIRRDVAKILPVTEVKNIVRNAYLNDPARTKALFIFGHVAVPYSGDISPDFHPYDEGAWPADVYYAEFDGQWTDTVVNITNTENPNVPGDGKFDQSEPPGPVRLQMGRVDLSNLTCFANKTPARFEVDLARQYLNKDHNFRHGLFDVQRRALIFDRIYRGLEPEPQTCAAWRSFPGFFGQDQVRVIGQDEYFPILASNSYLWSYAVSGGNFYGADYIGTSDSWALNEPKVVFTSFLGSGFGQWDKESDFLRAPLGTSGYTLACIYSGQPQWILHPMSMGEPIGEAARLTQNNSPGGLYPPQINGGFGQVHIDLMGDPGLRMHPVSPPGRVSGNVGGDSVALTWVAAPNRAVFGYYVYKADSEAGPFARISGENPVTTTSFIDPGGNANSRYMVRALKLEQTPSGSYYNLSQGMFFPDSLASSGIPEAPRNLAVSAIRPGTVDIDWLPPSTAVRGFEIQRRSIPDGVFTKIGEASATASSYGDSNLSAGQYAYRIKALGFGGDSDFSGEATLNLQPSWGAIVGTDRTTGGNWIGRYGQEGYVVILAATNYPSYATVVANNISDWVMSWDTTGDSETLLRPDGQTRLAAYWLSIRDAPLVLSFRFADSLTHRVSLYMVDYKNGQRSGTVDLMDPFSNRVFSSLYFTNVVLGEYVTMDVRNFVDVRISPGTVGGVVMSGLFFSTPVSSMNGDQAIFLATDNATQGSWQGKYGAFGDSIPSLSQNLPAEVLFDASANQIWTWADSTTDPRAVSKNSADAARIASAWYHPGECVFNITLNEPRQLALYFLDWDHSGRVEDLTVTDAVGATLFQQRIQNFEAGQYLVLRAEGKLRISLRRVSGPNAILNGIFVDPAQIVPAEQPRLDLPKFDIASRGYIMRISGQAGQIFNIESSLDLRAWNVVGRATLSGETKDYPLPYRSDPGGRFYRVVGSQ